MAIGGYGTTVVPTALTTITADVQAVTINGLTLDFSEIKEVGDTNRITTNLPMTVREGTLEITMTYVKTIYATLHTALLAQTSDTWTITDAGGSTHAGLGVVAGLTSLNFDTDGHATYTLTVQPTTSWAFTAN